MGAGPVPAMSVHHLDGQRMGEREARLGRFPRDLRTGTNGEESSGKHPPHSRSAHLLGALAKVTDTGHG